MILRPVRPRRRGAAQLELAGGVDEHLVVVVGELLGDDGRITCSMRSGLISVSGRCRACVLGGDEHGLQPHRAVVLVVEGDLGLAVGAQVGQDPGLADLGQALGQRWASQIGSGMRSSVSSQA
jgi:hypothetical protein